jgi:mycothiol S-conjugate amidase
VLITATGGEEGDILNEAMDRPEVRADIAAVRAKELEKATSIIGYDRVVKLGFRDSGMPASQANSRPDAFVNAPLPDVLAPVVGLLRQERPQVLIGYDEHEYYPHPDHLRVHELSVAAFEAASDPDQFPDSGEPWSMSRLVAPVVSPRRFQALNEAMTALGHDPPYTRWLERFAGSDPPRVDISVNVAETVAIAREALRAHATQVAPDGPWFAVPTEVVVASYPYEDYQLLAGTPFPEGATGLFDGL